MLCSVLLIRQACFFSEFSNKHALSFLFICVFQAISKKYLCCKARMSIGVRIRMLVGSSLSQGSGGSVPGRKPRSKSGQV